MLTFALNKDIDIEIFKILIMNSVYLFQIRESINELILSTINKKGVSYRQNNKGLLFVRFREGKEVLWGYNEEKHLIIQAEKYIYEVRQADESSMVLFFGKIGSLMRQPFMPKIKYINWTLKGLHINEFYEANLLEKDFLEINDFYRLVADKSDFEIKAKDGLYFDINKMFNFEIPDFPKRR